MRTNHGSNPALFESIEHRVLLSGVANGDKAPLFDYSDAFYAKNGIIASKLAGRPTGTGASVTSPAPSSDYRNIRLTGLVGMHDEGGKPNFFAVLGTFKADAFTANSAGQEAREIADEYVAYIFPKAGTNPLSPASKRQDELIPLNHGYFSNDPVALWREAFVNYVPGSIASGSGKRTADELRAKNGNDTDGTPFIRTTGDLDKARSAGIVTVSLRNDDGSQGAPWFVCAVFKDFSRNAITRDSTLTFVRNADGTIPAGEQDIKTLFDRLRNESKQLIELSKDSVSSQVLS